MATTIATNSSTTVMNDVLTELGWNTGVHLPIATIENQQLQKELERLIHARAAANAHLLQLRNKRQEFENHSKHLSQEQVEIASLLTTQRGTKQAENDQLVVLQVEQSKLSQDVTDFKKKENDIGDREKSLCKTLNNLFKRLDELKKTVSYDTDAIRLWEDSLLKTEEDNAIIKKFSEQDQNKAKELELKRQKLHKELDTRQHTLNKLFNEINGIEVALNKSHQMYLDAKKDRTNLLNQWHETVQHLRQRHKDMHLINMEIEKLRETLAKKNEDIEEQKTFYLNQLNNNKETEKQTQDLAKEAARSREKLLNTINTVRDVVKELHIGKYELGSLENTLHQGRTKCKQLGNDITAKREQLEQVNKTNKHLSKQLENLKNKKMTTNERARELQKMVDNTQSIVNALTTEIERLQTIVFRSTQQLQKLHEIDDSYQIDIRSLKLSIEMMEKQEKALEREVQKSREDVYDFDFNILQIESHIEHIEGSVREQFSEELDHKLKELLSILNEKNYIKQTLTKQISTVQDDIRRFGFQFVNDNIELAKLQESLHKEIKMVEGGKRQVKAGQIRSQEKQVEENILRLRVMQAQKNLDNIDNSLYTLEKQRIEMETAMKERQIEIGMERDVLALRKRNLLEDKSGLRGEIQERLLKNEQYKKKFEYQVSLLGTDDDGRPLSPTYFKLKTTQERVLLQQEGDEWDLKVKQAEQEIVAMENTLKLVNISNDKFKMSLCPVEETGPEEEEFKTIEQEHYCLLKKLRAAQRKQLECSKMMENVTKELKIIDEHLEKFNNEKSYLENELAVSKKDISLQEDRLTRSNRILSKLSVKVRPNLQDSFEKEISLRNFIDSNQSAIQQLLELSIRHLETSPNITRLCEYYRISLPGIEKFRPIARRLSQISLPQTIASGDQSSDATNSIYNPTGSISSNPSISTTNIQFSSNEYILRIPSGSSDSTILYKSSDSLKKKK